MYTCTNSPVSLSFLTVDWVEYDAVVTTEYGGVWYEAVGEVVVAIKLLLLWIGLQEVSGGNLCVFDDVLLPVCVMLLAGGRSVFEVVVTRWSGVRELGKVV